MKNMYQLKSSEEFCYQLKLKNFACFETEVVNSGFEIVYEIDCFPKIELFISFTATHFALAQERIKLVLSRFFFRSK